MRGAGLRGLSQEVQLSTWSQNKLWRSNSIFNLWYRGSAKTSCCICPTYGHFCGLPVLSIEYRRHSPVFFIERTLQWYLFPVHNITFYVKRSGARSKYKGFCLHSMTKQGVGVKAINRKKCGNLS
jgi:hypothetical protein